MGSHVVSFRFSDQEIELLRQQASSPDESTNAIAQRLLRDVLGVSTSTSTNVDNLESRVQAIVDARMSAIASQFVDKRIQERLQEEMATILGESVA
jgi:regulator of protease activity HflC (stomatin/prohibitin superfamily)